MWSPRRVPKYTSLPNSEAGARSSSAQLLESTEPRRPWKFAQLILYFICVVSIAISLGMNIWLLSKASSVRAKGHRWTPIPDVPLETVTFASHERFVDPPSAENDAAWANLITGKHLTDDVWTLGFTLVEEPDKYGLPPGMPYNGTTKVYGISMFHQLHCLRMLRNEFWSDGEVEGQERKHIAHCFDYLRQAIMCAGDMTLEWANWKGKEPRIDGWGMKHRGCRIWEAVGEYMKKHDVPGYVET